MDNKNQYTNDCKQAEKRANRTKTKSAAKGTHCFFANTWNSVKFGRIIIYELITELCYKLIF